METLAQGQEGHKEEGNSEIATVKEQEGNQERTGRPVGKKVRL